MFYEKNYALSKFALFKTFFILSPPWCGYLVHIFGIFDCSYRFGT